MTFNRILTLDETVASQELTADASSEPELTSTDVQAPQTTQQTFFKSARQILWEQRNPKIHAKFKDEHDHVMEIREVNRGRQLGFWDNTKNLQIFVHKQKDNTYESNGIVLKGIHR